MKPSGHLIKLACYANLLNVILLIANSLSAHKTSHPNPINYEYIRTATQRSVGSVIPWPERIELLNGLDYLSVQATNFTLNISPQFSECGIIVRAVERYIGGPLFDDRKPLDRDDPHNGLRKAIGSLSYVQLEPGFDFKCESMPHENMDEAYSIRIESSQIAKLVANSSWGFIRGLETIAQLIFNVGPGLYGIQTVKINDQPRFKHRGYLLDTARHYIPVKKIADVLEAMAINKMNVFHWHLVDDQSFPYESSSFPEISKMASFRPELVYTQNDVQFVVRYAADRGIRVVPELDSPGHTYSLRFVPDVLTKCYNITSGQPNGDLGPVDPTKLEAYRTIGKLIKEFSLSFPDRLMHAGGDEVDLTCWQSNPHIKSWMAARNMTGFQKLNNYYIRRIYDLMTHYNKTMLVWQEVFDSGAGLPRDAVVHVWKYINDRPAYMDELKNVVDAGYKAILSSCWYLNYIDYAQDWIKFYQCDPTANFIADDQAHLVLGGEVCMWAEFVDETNVVSRTWPRASAAAERLWSPKNKTNVGEFMGRLEQLRCRMLYRGLQAEPVNGPGYC